MYVYALPKLQRGADQQVSTTLVPRYCFKIWHDLYVGFRCITKTLKACLWSFEKKFLWNAVKTGKKELIQNFSCLSFILARPIFSL